MPISINGSSLHNISIIRDEQNTYFKLEDNERENYILLEYPPIFIDEYSPEDFQLVLFENNYLSAENDVFEVHTEKSRIGWLFPLSNIEGKENDAYSNIHLNKYKKVAFHLLLEAKEKNIVLPSGLEQYNISDIYPNNPIILVLSNKQTRRIEDFSVTNYFPSLSKYGYYIQNDISNSVHLNSKQMFCLEFRGKKKLTITNSSKVSVHRYYSELFSIHLKSANHHLVRFHMLYQVIESILTENFDAKFKYIINQFHKGEISKNDFIEEIKLNHAERSNIRKIITEISQQNLDCDTESLKCNCVNLLNNRTKKNKKDLGDLIYDVRNLIVHNYRELNVSDIKTLENILNELELLIINLIEKYITPLN